MTEVPGYLDAVGTSACCSCGRERIILRFRFIYNITYTLLLKTTNVGKDGDSVLGQNVRRSLCVKCVWELVVMCWRDGPRDSKRLSQIRACVGRRQYVSVMCEQLGLNIFVSRFHSAQYDYVRIQIL